MDITVQQAAKRLKVTPARVWQMIDDGRIKARYLSPRVVLIDDAELTKPAVKVRKPGRPSLSDAVALIASFGDTWEPVWSDIELNRPIGSIRAIIFPTPEQAIQHQKKAKDAATKAGKVVTLGIPRSKKGVRVPPPAYCLLVRAGEFARLALAGVPMVQFTLSGDEVVANRINPPNGRPAKNKKGR